MINKLSFPLKSSRVFFSTKTQIQYFPKKSSLYHQIVNLKDPKASVIPVLDQWVNEGNTVRKALLRSLVNLMKGFNRFNHALQISQWMADRPNLTLSPSDVVVRLELVHRIYGSAHAEKYFEKLPDKFKCREVYCALLSGYVQESSVQKAEAIMEEMRAKGMANSCFPYNLLINLYTKNGDYEKINMLIQEMETNGLVRGAYTMSNLMAAYVAASNISGMERILNQIEKDPQLGNDWRVYSVATSGYLKFGLIEKALTMLRKLEDVMPLEKKTSAFDILVTLYGKTGKRDELYLVWNTYKPLIELKETSVMTMISSLSKLDDIKGAEKIFREWESQCMMYDFRVLNTLLFAYCRKGLLKKAEAAVEKAAKDRTPCASSWGILAMGYIEHNQMYKAVEMLKKALSISGQGWRPNSMTLTACLNFLEKQGDVEGVEEVTKLLKSLEPLNEVTKELGNFDEGYNIWINEDV